MNRLTVYLVPKLRAWLGVEIMAHTVHQLLATAPDQDALITGLRSDLDATNAALAEVTALAQTTQDQLLTEVRQLNHNTVTMARWSKESATLGAIDDRYRAKLKREHAAKNGTVQADAPEPHEPSPPSQ